MQEAGEDKRTEYPPVRITTLGEFALERLVPPFARTADEQPHYALVARSDWSNRGPAMAMLKVLLCRANRRASRDELIEAIWKPAAHAAQRRRNDLQTGWAAAHLGRRRCVSLTCVEGDAGRVPGAEPASPARAGARPRRGRISRRRPVR